MTSMQELKKENLVLDNGQQVAVVTAQILFTPEEYKEFLDNVNEGGEAEITVKYNKNEPRREAEKKTS